MGFTASRNESRGHAILRMIRWLAQSQLRIGDEIVAVGIEALDGHEEIAGLHLTRVLSQPIDVRVYTTVDFYEG